MTTVIANAMLRPVFDAPERSGASAPAEPSTSLDDPLNLDFVDPDEDNHEQSEAGIEQETEPVAADGEGQETDVPGETQQEEAPNDELEVEGEGQPLDQEAEEDASDRTPVADDAIVSLPAGGEVSFAELKSGYMKEQDYRHKTHELGVKRRGVEEIANRMTRMVEVFSEHLAGQLPQEPNASLAVTDPTTYNQQKALYDAQLAQLQHLIGLADEPREVGKELGEQVSGETLAQENEALGTRFPMTRDQKGRERFFKSAFGAAAEFGYSDQEMRSVTDHRLLGMAYYAKLGMDAEKAKSTAKQKVLNAPPVVPKKKQQAKQAAAIRKNTDAMQRLERTGSIHDAVNIDFD